MSGLRLLDTNIVSAFLRNEAFVVERMAALAPHELVISAVTHGELRYGLAKRPTAARLHRLVEAFLARIATLSWDVAAADRYGELRAEVEGGGCSLAPLDMMIAAHASAANAILVTRDRAFARIGRLSIEDWSH